jgi:sec-independent protein translocase protein TatB
MFDVGFSEILIIAVVALLVLGPERLPKAARFAGLWVRRARAQWYSVKAELERELASEELQRSLKEPLEQLQQLQPQMRALDAELREEFAGLDPTRPATPAAAAATGGTMPAETTAEAATAIPESPSEAPAEAPRRELP